MARPAPGAGRDGCRHQPAPMLPAKCGHLAWAAVLSRLQVGAPSGKMRIAGHTDDALDNGAGVGEW